MRKLFPRATYGVCGPPAILRAVRDDLVLPVLEPPDWNRATRRLAPIRRRRDRGGCPRVRAGGRACRVGHAAHRRLGGGARARGAGEPARARPGLGSGVAERTGRGTVRHARVRRRRVRDGEGARPAVPPRGAAPARLRPARARHPVQRLVAGRARGPSDRAARRLRPVRGDDLLPCRTARHPPHALRRRRRPDRDPCGERSRTRRGEKHAGIRDRRSSTDHSTSRRSRSRTVATRW